MKRTATILAAAMLLACTTVPQPVAPPALVDVVSELERECLANPLNPEAWRRLANALTGAGEFERAARALRQAAMLEQNDLRADLALVAAAPPAGLAATRLVVHADGMVELRREQQGVLLEVRNGNGVRGMARQFAGTLDEDGIQVVRLSNQRGFAVLRSVVEYDGAYAGAARQLAGRIGAEALPASRGLGVANVRVLLGHDQKKKKPPRRAAMEEKSLLEKIS